MKKILIIYGSRKGVTAETSEFLGGELELKMPCEPHILDVKKFSTVKKRVAEYDAVIIGSSIVSGRWVSGCLRVLRKMARPGIRTAVFVTAGGTMNKVKKYGISKEEAITEAQNKYIVPWLNRYGITPVSTAVFGGRVEKRGVIRYNSRDENDVRAWADELCLKLT